MRPVSGTIFFSKLPFVLRGNRQAFPLWVLFGLERRMPLTRIIEALSNRRAYPHGPKPVRVVQTHISVAIIADDFVFRPRVPVCSRSVGGAETSFCLR